MIGSSAAVIGSGERDRGRRRNSSPSTYSTLPALTAGLATAGSHVTKTRRMRIESGRFRHRGIQRDRRGDGQARGRSRSPAVLAARRCERIEALPKELPDAVAVPTDVTDAEQVRAMVDTAVQCYGRVDMLVNNAARVAA